MDNARLNISIEDKKQILGMIQDIVSDLLEENYDSETLVKLMNLETEVEILGDERKQRCVDCCYLIDNEGEWFCDCYQKEVRHIKFNLCNL